jgi:hypothetical protein
LGQALVISSPLVPSSPKYVCLGSRPRRVACRITLPARSKIGPLVLGAGPSVVGEWSANSLPAGSSEAHVHRRLRASGDGATAGQLSERSEQILGSDGYTTRSQISTAAPSQRDHWRGHGWSWMRSPEQTRRASRRSGRLGHGRVQALGRGEEGGRRRNNRVSLLPRRASQSFPGFAMLSATTGAKPSAVNDRRRVRRSNTGAGRYFGRRPKPFGSSMDPASVICRTAVFVFMGLRERSRQG